VQGVRRWIGSRKSTTEKKARGKSTAKAEMKASPQEQILNPRSTAAVALALLDPQVSDLEEAEYQGFVLPYSCPVQLLIIQLPSYIEQCQELLDAPVTSLEKRNLEVYVQTIETGMGFDDCSSNYDVPKEFVGYVERSTTDYLDGARKEAFPTTFNYERWLTSIP